MDFAVETYQTEAELLAARPQWTPAHVELEVEHPVEADVRDFGMALFLGTGIALSLLGAAGMELVFGTPVKYAVFTAAIGGLIVATVITTWSNVRWKKRRLRRQQQTRTNGHGDMQVFSQLAGQVSEAREAKATPSVRQIGGTGKFILRILGYRPESESGKSEIG
jgi:hypothetical protein